MTSSDVCCGGQRISSVNVWERVVLRSQHYRATVTFFFLIQNSTCPQQKFSEAMACEPLEIYINLHKFAWEKLMPVVPLLLS